MTWVTDPAQFTRDGGIVVFPVWVVVALTMSLGLLRTGSMLSRRIEAEDRLRKQFPDEPTKWSEEWLAGRGQVDYEWLYGRDFLLSFGMFLTPLTLALLPIWLSKSRIDPVAIMGLIGGLSAGVISLSIWAYLRLQTWRARKGEVTFNPIPLTCGTPAEFQVNLGMLNHNDRKLQIRLRCIYRHRASASRPPSTKVEFMETQMVALPRSIEGVQRLSATFYIPQEALETSFLKRGVIRWELRIRTSGIIPKLAQFVVPVR